MVCNLMQANNSSLALEEDTVNQQNYLNMLESYFNPIIQKKRLHKIIIFQQDGAPAHF